VPRQQSVLRDVALVVGDHVGHDALIDTLRDDAAGLVRSATLFDIYQPAAPTADIPAGHRSLGVRMELLDQEATLTDDRIDAPVAQAQARASAPHGARLRA
jgi:phenylalanyl-tRNA synthetase beta chain